MRALFFFVCLVIASSVYAGELSVESYLKQVAEQDNNYKSADASREAAQLYSKEADLLYALTLFGVYEDTDDKKPGTFFSYDETYSRTYEAGLSETTPIGLSAKLFYQVLDTGYTNLDFGGPTVSPNFRQASPVFQFTFELWRNWWGGQDKANVEQGEAQAAANLHSQTFQTKQILQQAETAYWQLALARESQRVSQDSVTRNQQLVAWHRQRASTGLADRADLLQAEAALENSMLSLKTQQDSEVSAARAFNLARGVNSDQVKETLERLSSEDIAKMKIPERNGHREDVLAALEQERASTAGADAAREKYLPTVELYGTYALNNGDPTNISGAMSDSFNDSRPTRTIGIRFNAPLDVGMIQDSRRGHNKDQVAAEMLYQRKLLEEESNWNDLVKRHQQAQEKYKLNQALEEKQKIKFEYEQHRRKLGRTTTQQVLNFETDFENAQFSRIQTLSDLLQIRAQLKLFEVTKNGSR